MKLTVATMHNATVDGWFIGPWTDLHESPIIRDKIDLTPPILCRTGPDLAHGRGQVVNTFLEDRDGDALLMIDSDMAYEAKTVVEQFDLWQKMMTANPVDQILGGLAFILGGPRVNPRNMCPTLWQDEPERGEPFMCQQLSYTPDTLYRVGGTGGACLMIGRKVLEDLLPNPFMIYGLPDGDRFGEDLSFCRRARDKGYTIHVHTGLRYDHAKTVLVGEPEYLPMLEAFGQLSQEHSDEQSDL